MLKLIIATANGNDHAIGCNNKLLEHIPEDLRYFQAQTTNQVVLMGNTTMKSLRALGMENGLPNRHNVVLSRTPKKTTFLKEGETTYITDLKFFLEWGTMYANNVLEKDVWVVGGSQIYSQLKDYVQEIHHSCINKTYEDADCFFDMSWVEDEEVFEKVSEEVLCDDVVVKVYRKRL